MIVAGEYSFNRGSTFVAKRFQPLLDDVYKAIAGVDSSIYKTKKSEEKTMRGRRLYSPKALNKAFKREFLDLGWANCNPPSAILVACPSPLNPLSRLFACLAG